MAVSDTVSLAAINGSVCGSVKRDGTFSPTRRSSDRWKLGKLDANQLGSFKATLSNNGMAVSATVSLAGIKGSVSGSVKTDGTFSFDVALAVGWKLGKLDANQLGSFKATLSNNGMAGY